jgi:probable addiction module antidote protein
MTEKIKFVKIKPERLATFRDFRETFIEDLAKSKKDRELYLKIAIEDYEQDKDLPAFLLALRTIAIANGGIQDLALKTNLHRQTIYKALSPKGNPSFALIDSIVNSFGMKLFFKAI